MDGVLIKSVDVKMRVFRELFSDYPDYEIEIDKYLQENQGVSRYKKIPYIVREILGVDHSNELESELLDKLAIGIREAMKEVPLIPGCSEFLSRYSASIPCAVISAAPEEEAVTILSDKGIAHHFRMILGSPKSKTINIKDFLNFYGLKAENSIMFGDSMTDYNAADETGCRFVGVITQGETDQFLGKRRVLRVIRNFVGLNLLELE